MKFLVVGSTGLIGSYVAKTLSKHGTVIGVSRTTQISVDLVLARWFISKLLR
jgi:nucleoside-diphosphate-sugar epimerase